MPNTGFIPQTYSQNCPSGSFTCSSPSNIALVKYWGKFEPQLPANPSISFTLNDCKTITTVSFQEKSSEDFSFDFYFDNQPKDSFKPKIETFFKRVSAYLPFLKNYHFEIRTENTFPHSSGIASSASGMAALSVNLMCIEKQLNPEMTDNYFWEKASFLARLGSGSACRSLKGELVVWGKTNSIPNSSDLFGIPFPFEIHENFKNYRDTILIVEEGQKSVSSTVGHELMNNHPFAQKRFEQAHENLTKISTYIQNGNLTDFIDLVESEALTLHAMMLTSSPSFILMRPETLEIINRIRAFRKATSIPVCFTLDAGANVHLLHPDEFQDAVSTWVKSELAAYCQGGRFIEDHLGNGSIILQ